MLQLLKSKNQQGICYPKLSEFGDWIYAVYTEGDCAAQILKVDQYLSARASIPISSDFPDVRAGDASSGFEFFTLLESNPTTYQSRLRLFTFTNAGQLQVLASRTFENTQYCFGGVFSADDQYIAVTYVSHQPEIAESKELNNKLQTSVLVVLEVQEELKIVAQTNFFTHTNGPRFIQGQFYMPVESKVAAEQQPKNNKHNKAATWTKETFLVIPCGNSIEEAPYVGPPANLLVFHLKRRLSKTDHSVRIHSLHLFAEAPLPQFPLSCTVFFRVNRLTNINRPIIAIGTRTALLAGEVHINSDVKDNLSFLPMDGDELRLYEFSVSHPLRLVYTHNPNVSVGPLVYNKATRQLLIGYNPANSLIPSSVLTMTTFTLRDIDLHAVTKRSADKGQYRLQLERSDPPPFFEACLNSQSNFSKDGTKLVCGGSNELSNNLNLWSWLPTQKSGTAIKGKATKINSSSSSSGSSSSSSSIRMQQTNPNSWSIHLPIAVQGTHHHKPKSTSKTQEDGSTSESTDDDVDDNDDNDNDDDADDVPELVAAKEEKEQEQKARRKEQKKGKSQQHTSKSSVKSNIKAQ